MATAIASRGRDDEGLWCDPGAALTLAFRRLSILDLSEAGHQPMVSHSGRHVLAFNGEIYNFEDLRATLDAQSSVAWRGHSDTEVLLEALSCWGVEETLPRLDGMFAFALWDRLDRTLVLARDCFGEKPLVYGWQSGVFLFGSTLHALRAHPAARAAASNVSPTAVSAYFQRGFIPAPLTIHEGLFKLPAGTWAILRAEAAPGSTIVPRCHFDPVREAEGAQSQQRRAPGRGDDEILALHRLSTLIQQSVKRRLRADVSLGIFLSGGIDSSTVAAFAADASPTPVRTFTISFPGTSDDEAPYARKVASYLGTDHTEIAVTKQEALASLAYMTRVYDEPFADPSALPSMILCRHTSTVVTVALSGDGGDEFFGGYPRYPSASADVARTSSWPAPMRRLAERMTMRLPSSLARKQLARIAVETPRDAYLPYLTRWRWRSPARLRWRPPDWPPTTLVPAERFMVADAAEYLPDNLQVKIDRASMAFGLEVRAPLLDREIAKFAWGLPLDLRLHPVAGGKFLLRKLLGSRLPPAFFERPKQGFYQPLPNWLRADLREWAEGLLSERALHRSGLIDPVPVRQAWREHQRGRNRALDLWTVLIFQHWLSEIHGDTNA